jgi:hypothetical protein
MKRALTQSDHEALESARGLSLHNHLSGRKYADRRGLIPSVTDYNKAVEQGVLRR